jgi:DNA processing protein
MSDTKFWVAFTTVKGIGAVRLQTLLDAFGDAESAWKASPLDLVAAGLSPRLAERVVQARASLDVDKLMQDAQNQGIQILTWDARPTRPI